MAGGLQMTDVLLGLLAPFTVYLFYIFVRFVARIVREARTAAKFPSGPSHWLYGNVNITEGYLGERFLWHIREIVSKYPLASSLWLCGWIGRIMVWHPQTIKQLLKASTTKSEDYEALRPWLGNGLLIGDGDVHKLRRRLLTPAFHFGVLKQYMSVFNAEASQTIRRLSSYVERGESFEMFQQASMTTMDILLQCAFSGGNLSEDEKTEYMAAVRRIEELITQRILNPVYVLSDFIYYLSPSGREFKQTCDFVHDIALSIIKQRRRELESGEEVLQEKKRPDFIDILLRARDEDGRGLSDLEIREEVDTVLMAGHDTTASALSWTLYSLAQHPEHQDKVREEVQQLLSDRTDDTVEWEDLSKLPYLTQCLKEAIRLYPTVPYISRKTKEDTVIDGKIIPKETYLGINLYALHHNPDIWGPDHMDFDPARFHPDRLKDMDSHAFMPFSAGQRNCIGQNFALNEEKVLLARLLHKFKFEAEPSRPVKIEFLGVMRSRSGMWLNALPVDRYDVSCLHQTAQKCQNQNRDCIKYGIPC